MSGNGCWSVFATIANFFIALAWLFVFQSLGWITFTADMPLWQGILVVAFLTWLVGWIIGWIYFIFIFLTCLVGCVTWPVYWAAYGFLVLLGAERITHLFMFAPGNDVWVYLLMSVAYGILRLPTSLPSFTSTSTSSSGSSN